MIFAHRKARLLYQMSNLINSQSLARLIRLLCRMNEGDFRSRNAPPPTDSHHVADDDFWNDPDCAGIGRRRRSVTAVGSSSRGRLDHIHISDFDCNSVCVFAGGSVEQKEKLIRKVNVIDIVFKTNI